MSTTSAGSVPAQADNPEFELLFREQFRPLVRFGLSLPGISLEEAEDAAEAGLAEVFRRWPELSSPRAYAYKATMSNLMKIKNRERAQDRIVRLQIERGDVQPEAREDPGLAAVEYRLWVTTMLDGLPPAQREAVACCLVGELSPAEASAFLGKSGPALRQALHAGRLALQHYLVAENAAEPAASAGASSIPAATARLKEVR